MRTYEGIKKLCMYSRVFSSDSRSRYHIYSTLLFNIKECMWVLALKHIYFFFFVIKNVSSSTIHKKKIPLSVCLSSNLRKFFLTHSFMNRFWYKFIWMPTLWIGKYLIYISMTSTVIEGHKGHFYVYFNLCSFRQLFVLVFFFYHCVIQASEIIEA